MKRAFILFLALFLATVSMAKAESIPDINSISQLNAFLSKDLATIDIPQHFSSDGVFRASALKTARHHADKGNLDKAKKALLRAYKGRIVTITFTVNGETKTCKFFVTDQAAADTSLGCY